MVLCYCAIYRYISYLSLRNWTWTWKPAEILECYILPLSSYAPRDFVCMSSRAFTLFDDCPEAFIESSGYVRYLKFN